eukprot:COSAG02_NODE_7889_length_2803_cov_28.147189_4_plen_136_part_00
MSVCFNTVAVLFLCEIDNLAYAIGLGEKLRARVDTEGRVELGEAEADALILSKTVHVCVLVAVVPCIVWAGGRGDTVGLLVAYTLSVLVFWLAGAVEAVADATGAAEACKEVGRVTGWWLLGLVGFGVLLVATMV